MHWVRQSFKQVLGQEPEELGMELVYDVAHNIAKKEEHIVEGARKKVVVHRKGATRAFGPDHPEVPIDYRDIGQPVLIPGDMGTASYLLLGTGKAMEESFGSTCHGAGRVMSRKQARTTLPLRFRNNPGVLPFYKSVGMECAWSVSNFVFRE